jgi:hypothetical protein
MRLLKARRVFLRRSRIIFVLGFRASAFLGLYLVCIPQLAARAFSALLIVALDT